MNGLQKLQCLLGWVSKLRSEGRLRSLGQFERFLACSDALRRLGAVRRDAWQAIGRELLRLGLVDCAPGKFATLSLTSAGLETLRKRSPITLTKHIDVAESV